MRVETTVQKTCWAVIQFGSRWDSWKMHFWELLVLTQVTSVVDSAGIGPFSVGEDVLADGASPHNLLSSHICFFSWKGWCFVKLSGTFQSPFFRYQGVLEGKDINEQCDRYRELLFWLGNWRGIWEIYCTIIVLCDIDAAVLMTAKCPDWFRWPFTVIITNPNK